jgi:hypothetical protein
LVEKSLIYLLKGKERGIFMNKKKWNMGQRMERVSGDLGISSGGMPKR